MYIYLGKAKKIMEKKGEITIKKVPESPPAIPLGVLSVCPQGMSAEDRSPFSQLGSAPPCLSCVRVRHPKQTPGIRMLKMILLPHGPDTQANSFICDSTEEKVTVPKLRGVGAGGGSWQSWVPLQDAVVASNLATT